jgi:protein TonB
VTVPGPGPARPVRAGAARLRHFCAVLAHPDRYGYNERSAAWLTLALLLSFAAHLALLSTLVVHPKRFGTDFRIPLRVGLEPLPPSPTIAQVPEAPSEPKLVRAAPASEGELLPPAMAAPSAPAPVPPPQAAAQPPATNPPAEEGKPLELPLRYFQARDLDVPARPLGRAPLIYPQGAHHLRIAGVVRVRVRIDAAGKVDSLEVVSADPPGQFFEESALAAMKQMRYAPAIKDGRAVPSEKLVEVRFDPDEDARPAGQPTG